MKIKKVTAVYFSAVGNTKKVVETIATEMAIGLGVAWGSLDFTLPVARSRMWEFSQEDLVVFGVPTYAGRVPNKVLPFVEELFRGQETLVVPVVTFGNRSFDSALSELAQALNERGFLVMGAGAFACEHVFSERIGSGRPDREDLVEIHSFAVRLVDKIIGADVKGGENLVEICEGRPVGPYYTPLGLDGQPAKFLKAKPVTDLETCDGCGLCAAVCPMGSIDADDVTQVTGICVKCQACIRKCPQSAKHFVDEAFCSHVAMLEETYIRRAENAVYL